MSAFKLYVGNLSYRTTDDELRVFFEQYVSGLADVIIITDRETLRSRGFGFVHFNSEEDMKAALQANGQELGGRRLTVNVAKEERRGDKNHSARAR